MSSLKINTVPLIAASFFALAASSANATDIFDQRHEATADQAQGNWSGLWVGAMGGYQFSNSSVTDDAKEIDNDGVTVEWHEVEKFDGLGADGLFGELQAGFDKQIGSNTVVGVFGGFNINDAEFSYTESSGVPLDVDSSISFDQEWGGVLGARVGLLKNPDTLFYAAGGWAFGKLGDIKVDGEAATEIKDTDLSGWFAELGMETRLTSNLYLTFSGRYTDYGSLDAASETVECCYEAGDQIHKNLELDHDTLAVMVGLKAKLGGF
jgi:outer membrane immunogenic protein